MKKVKSGDRSSAKKGKTVPRTFAEYLAAAPKPTRSMLVKMRAAIRSALPREATETMSYGIPAFQYQTGVLVWFAAFSNHCSLFPTAAVITAFRDKLESFSTSKGTIHFPLGDPLPTALIRTLVKARLKQVDRKERHKLSMTA